MSGVVWCAMRCGVSSKSTTLMLEMNCRVLSKRRTVNCGLEQGGVGRNQYQSIIRYDISQHQRERERDNPRGAVARC